MVEGQGLEGKTVANLDTFLNGLWKENPVLVTILGMCPTLAVSNSVINAFSMGVATTFVLVMSNFLISLIRNLVPKQVRMATFIMIIATFVTVAEYVIQAISIEIHRSLGAFISLIVVNCIILGRAEAFASKNRVIPSILDGFGSGFGFTLAICCMGAIRDVLGSGAFAGVDLFGPHYEPWVVMILPSGGFFIFGLLLLFSNWLNQRLKRKGA